MQAHGFYFLPSFVFEWDKEEVECDFLGRFLFPRCKIKTALRIFRPGTWLKICHLIT